MMDKSSAELGAVAAVHPQCFRLLCDFHHAQAVEWWVNKGTNGVHPTDKALVTDAFRRLAYMLPQVNYVTQLIIKPCVMPINSVIETPMFR